MGGLWHIFTHFLQCQSNLGDHSPPLSTQYSVLIHKGRVPRLFIDPDVFATQGNEAGALSKFGYDAKVGRPE